MSARPALPRWAVLGLPLLVALAWKAAELALPPHGEHAWRDADGVGVARSFLRDGWNLLEPRVAERGALTGIVGMEFPLLNWLGAALMAALGERELWARLPVWLSLVPLALAGLALGRRLLSSEDAARLGAACLVLQPLVLVFSRKLMPEVPMLAVLCAGLALAHDGLLRASRGRALAGGLLLALAAVLKPTGFAAAVPVLLWARQAGRASLGRAALSALPPVLAVLAWFSHARSLEERYGLPLFRLRHDWLEWTHLLADPTFLGAVFGRVLHLYLLWPTVIAMVIWRREALAALRTSAPLAAWAGAALVGVVLFGSHNYQHSYYAMPLLPPLALLVGEFFARASQRFAAPGRAQAAFLVIFAVTALVRTLPRFPPIAYDAGRVEQAMARQPEALTVATDAKTPVVSLVALRRVGWALPPESLTPSRIAELQAQGARLLVESSFGGWLPEASRAALPQPDHSDDQVRIYRLAPR